MTKATRPACLLLAALVPLCVLQAQSNYATPYTFTTLAGLAGTTGIADGTGSAARFGTPYGMAVDGAGNIYVADAGSHTIRKITSQGVVTTLAGQPAAPGTANGTGSAARFNHPSGVAVDGAGNVYVADTSNHTIRKITSGGVVTTFAGTAGSAGSTDGTGVAARFNNPSGVSVDGSGNVYVADTFNHTIRMITPGGVVTTFAGTAGSVGFADGTGAAAGFNRPFDVAVDGSGNVYVADSYNQTIRKITSGGVVTTLAGTALNFGSTDGTGSAARFNQPYGVAVDGSGNVYVADIQNDTIRKISSTGVVTTLGGLAGTTGSTDGAGSTAKFWAPGGVAVDGAGYLYVADTGNATIRKGVVPTPYVFATLAGTAGSPGFSDGMGSAAQFNYPFGVAVDGARNLYVTDSGNQTIRKIDPTGLVSTLAGMVGISGSDDGLGSAASFHDPAGVAVDGAGNLYVADSGSSTIRKITPDGTVMTFAGTAGIIGSADGTGGAAQFYAPYGVAVDGVGNVYVADTNNSTIRKITSVGVVTTLAGTAGAFGSVDATGSAARFNGPFGIAVDGAGNVYVADIGNHTIRKITAAGVVTTLAGTAGSAGSTDGTGSAARFNEPGGVAVDGAGNVYVADTENDTIRKITPDSNVVTIGGMAGTRGSADGTGRAALFGFPYSLAVDGAGNVYVADFLNHTIRTGVRSSLVMPGDLDGDGRPDILWQNTSTGGRGIYLMNGTSFVSWADLGTIATALRIVGTGDFNGDGKTDILWENTVTGKRVIWLMNGTGFSSSVNLGIVSTDWRIAAVADFDGDGHPDILWENTVTGDRGVWLMKGTYACQTWVSLGIVPTDWRIAAVADFNGDGKPDILWENTVTGDRGFYLMNGTTYVGWVDLTTITTDWRIAAVADFNGDGNPDILLENTVTGDRGFYLMNGTTFVSWVDLTTITTDWQIAN